MVQARNPQSEQMAHESMVRNLAAQATAIWPQERPLFERYGIQPGARILDVGCGTGEIGARLLELLPDTHLLGVDVHAEHLERAREKCAPFGERAVFEVGDAYALDCRDGSFDLTVCRHLLQAIPEPERVLRELARVTRPGGRIHVVAEDYGMMHFHPVALDTDRFWREGPVTFARKTGTDLLVGRRTPTMFYEAGLADVRVDFVTIDTVRVPREIFAGIWSAWRDGYAVCIAQETSLSREEVEAAFETMLAAIRSPSGYGLWQLPVVSGVRR